MKPILPTVPDGASPDHWDALMAQGWLAPPDDFTQRVIDALPPPAALAPVQLQDLLHIQPYAQPPVPSPIKPGSPRSSDMAPPSWRSWVSALALVLAGAAGLGEVLTFLAGLWLATGAAG